MCLKRHDSHKRNIRRGSRNRSTKSQVVTVLKDVKTSTKNEGKNEGDEGDFVMVTRKLAHTTKREKNSRVVKQKGLTHVGDGRLNRQVGFTVPNKNPNQQKKTTKQSHFI